MVKTKKTTFKPLSAKNKIMIDTRKLVDRGITGDQLEKIIDAKFKKYIADDLRDLKLGAKELFYRAIIVGASFGVVGSFAVTTTFRFIDDRTPLNFVFALFGYLLLLVCLIYANRQFERFKITGQ